MQADGYVLISSVGVEGWGRQRLGGVWAGPGEDGMGGLGL